MLKKNFWQIKFPSDKGNQFYRPNVMTNTINRERPQSVQICEWIWEHIGIVFTYIYFNIYDLIIFLFWIYIIGKQPNLPTFKHNIIF